MKPIYYVHIIDFANRIASPINCYIYTVICELKPYPHLPVNDVSPRTEVSIHTKYKKNKTHMVLCALITITNGKK